MSNERRQLRGLVRIAALTATVSLLVSFAAVGQSTSTRRDAGSSAATEARDVDSRPPDMVPVPAFRQATKVGIITVEGTIDWMTYASLERRIGRALADGCDGLVIELDTPGGRMDACLDICNLLKDQTEVPEHTIAWVRPQAYSAGTVIALACREIVVTPNGTFGDAAPIYGMPVVGLIEMPAAERAKVEAPLLAEVIDSARRNHYDENLVQGFVSVGTELWMLEHRATGERVFVDRTEYRAIFGEGPPAQITSVTPSAGATTVTPRFDDTFRRVIDDSTGEVINLDDIAEGIELSQVLPPSRSPLTDADRDDWTLIAQVISDDRLLTVKAPEAISFGLAVEAIANDAELSAFFGASQIVRYERTWSESLVRVLVSWPVRIVLIIIMLVAGFIELAAPGLGVFGAVAGCALLLLIGAPALAGLAQWWDIMLVAVGLLLIAAEIFLIPGTGAAGFIGAVCLLVGLIGTFVSGDVTTTEGQDELWTGVFTTFTALFGGIVGIWLVSRQLHSIPILNRLVLKAEVGGTGVAGEGTVGIIEAMRAPGGDALIVGDTGVATTDLRPSGRAMFNERVIDVQSPARYIEIGRPVRVISVGKYVIEVEEIE